MLCPKNLHVTEKPAVPIGMTPVFRSRGSSYQNPGITFDTVLNILASPDWSILGKDDRLLFQKEDTALILL